MKISVARLGEDSPMPVAASGPAGKAGDEVDDVEAEQDRSDTTERDEAEPEPDAGRGVPPALDGVEAVDRRACRPEDPRDTEADAGEGRADVVGDVEHEREVAPDAAERDDEQRAQGNDSRYAGCRSQRAGRQGRSNRGDERQCADGETGEAGIPVVAAVEGQWPANAEQGDGGGESEGGQERLVPRRVRHVGGRAVTVPDGDAAQPGQEEQQRGDEEEGGHEEDEAPADECFGGPSSSGAKEARQDPGGGEGRKDLGPQVLGQRAGGEDEGGHVDESLGDAGESTSGDEDRHGRRARGHDLGGEEGDEPGEQDGARTGPVDPSPCHDDRDHERHHRGGVRRAEPCQPVQGTGRGRHDADGGAVLEGAEGDEGDDPGGDGEVRGAEEPLRTRGRMRWRCGR